VSRRSAIVWAIMAKDLKAFARDRFFLIVSVLGLVFYAVLFWVLPDTVDETIKLGVVQLDQEFDFGGIGGADQAAGSAQVGLEIITYADDAELRAAVEEGKEVVAGLALPRSLFDPTITVYIGPGVPPAVAGTVEGLAKELAYAVIAVPPPVSGFSTEQIVLGDDRAGDQVSLREKFRPLLALLVLLVESLALATLVATEVQARTVKAINVTPARLSDFLTAKALFGTLLAFGQAVVLMIAIRSLTPSPLILLVAVLLGSVLVTGFGLLAGSVGKDFIGIVFWSLLFLIPLMIPAMAVLFPGSAAGWIQALPSYPLARILIDVTSFGAGWAEATPLLGLLALWSAAALFTGWRVLERRVRTL
jgi:ABC-2 type transport system permease protein